MGNAVELKVLEHIVGKTSYTMPSGLLLALTTVTVVETDTGVTITRPTYTGYADKSVAGSDWGTAAAGQIANTNPITFAACTGGTSTLIGFALLSAAGGDVIIFGTLASLVVSATQTPVNFAAGALIATLD
jgi:hypothetical protein